VTECQGCGAWNDSSRTQCVLCGTPLAETDEWDAAAELPPLPPLPDGGLGASMPAWLRDAPSVVGVAEAAPSLSLDVPDPPAPPGVQADPRLFLTDDDFPRWLRDLAAREAVAHAGDEAPPAAPRPAALLPAWPATPATLPPSDAPAPAAPEPAERLPAAIIAARAREERPRSPWETLLLVILFIGVVIAALWALVSNGVFSPGM
jgi:hypothetical protein